MWEINFGDEFFVKGGENVIPKLFVNFVCEGEFEERNKNLSVNNFGRDGEWVDGSWVFVSRVYIGDLAAAD